MTFIDLHTHLNSSDNHIRIINVFAEDLSAYQPNGYFSAGLHPWHVEKVDPEECFGLIDRVASSENMLAIGECGIDRLISTPFAKQIYCFERQIELAVKHDKPLIIHCVRAYSDLLYIKKKSNSWVPWILHGYNGNLQITLNLLKHHFYFSIGERFLKTISRYEILRMVPLNRLFFETDESTCSIEEIYSMASQVLGIELDELVQTIGTNFGEVFGRFMET
jgi:TatD DNase family protein